MGRKPVQPTARRYRFCNRLKGAGGMTPSRRTLAANPPAAP